MVQGLRPTEKTSTIQEETEIEMDENLDNLETRSTTRASKRASGSTSVKRKSMTIEELPDTKKQQAGTILNFYNATINTHTPSAMSTSPTMTSEKKDESTVQSTPRTT
eukprot:512003-Amphidinium_carterae.1